MTWWLGDFCKLGSRGEKGGRMVTKIWLCALDIERRIEELHEDEQGDLVDHGDLKPPTQSPMHIMVDH